MSNNEGACAFVILQGESDTIVRYAKKRYTNETNNRMEMKAAMNAVYCCPDGSNIHIFSDSQYAIGALRLDKPVKPKAKNMDLIKAWRKMADDKKVSVTFDWVRGHSGNRWNEVCDALCQEAVGFDVNKEFEWYKNHKK